MKLPNTALRYKPPMPQEEVLALYKQYGIEMEQRQHAALDDVAEKSIPQGGGMGNLP